MKRIDLAYVDLGSSENARDINRDIVLEIVRSRQPVSRADLARASGLQPSTVRLHAGPGAVVPLFFLSTMNW
jgi:hypothetical protein